jgi:hypothetical protein
VPVDQCLVDPDRPGDVLDLGTDRTTLVEQPPGGRDDVPLAVAAALRRAAAAAEQDH